MCVGVFAGGISEAWHEVLKPGATVLRVTRVRSGLMWFCEGSYGLLLKVAVPSLIPRISLGVADRVLDFLQLPVSSQCLCWRDCLFVCLRLSAPARVSSATRVRVCYPRKKALLVHRGGSFC